MRTKSYAQFTHIVARELLSYPLESNFETFSTIAKQVRIKDVVITKNSIMATELGYNKLLMKLVECVYKN